MEGPGLVRWAATLDVASPRQPHTFWDEEGVVWGLPVHR